MALDDENPITPMQSQTIRLLVKAMAVNVLDVIARATGRAFDVDAITSYADSGVSFAVSGITLYYLARAIRARMNATQTIQRKDSA